MGIVQIIQLGLVIIELCILLFFLGKMAFEKIFKYPLKSKFIKLFNKIRSKKYNFYQYYFLDVLGSNIKLVNKIYNLEKHIYGFPHDKRLYDVDIRTMNFNGEKYISLIDAHLYNNGVEFNSKDFIEKARKIAKIKRIHLRINLITPFIPINKVAILRLEAFPCRLHEAPSIRINLQNTRGFNFCVFDNMQHINKISDFTVCKTKKGK